jgi:hypothetical protein
MPRRRAHDPSPRPSAIQVPAFDTAAAAATAAGAAAAASGEPSPVGGRISVTYTGAVHRAGDRLIMTAGELSKALLREVVHLCYGAAMGVVAGALDITLQPGYYVARHARIKRGDGDGVAAAAAAARPRRRGGARRFDALLSDESGVEEQGVQQARGGDAAGQQPGSSSGGGGGGGGGGDDGDDEDVVVDLRRANGFVRALLSRLANLHSLVIPRAELEVRLFGARAPRRAASRRERIGGGVAVMQHSAGVIERGQLRALVLLDSATDAARLALAWAAHSAVFATSPTRWALALRDARAGSGGPAMALATTPAPRPRGAPRRGMWTSRIVGEFCGHEAETLQVETADGYILRIIRIANRASNRVAIFQHGLLVRVRVCACLCVCVCVCVCLCVFVCMCM